MDKSLSDAAIEASQFWKFGDGSDNAEGELQGIYRGISDEEFQGRAKKVIHFEVDGVEKFLGAGARLLKAMIAAKVDVGDEIVIKRWGKSFETSYSVKVV